MTSRKPFSVLSVCAACGAQNRIPAAHLADRGRCGACKAPLSPTSEPIETNADSFDEIVSSARVPILVDFWATWCGPCRMAAPEVHQLAQQMAGRALVLKVDIDAVPALAGRYRIQSVPTFLVLFKGQLVSQRSGLVPGAEMRRWLESAGA